MYEKWDIHCGIYSIGKNPIKHFAAMKMRGKKAMKRGIFWVIENKVFAFVFEEGTTVGVAKSGNNFNHRLLWDSVKPPKCNKPYNYYPRGRVEITGGGKPVIYMSPHIGAEHIPEIRRQFGIDTELKVHYDGSRHYRCYMDIETDS